MSHVKSMEMQIDFYSCGVLNNCTVIVSSSSGCAKLVVEHPSSWGTTQICQYISAESAELGESHEETSGFLQIKGPRVVSFLIWFKHHPAKHWLYIETANSTHNFKPPLAYYDPWFWLDDRTHADSTIAFEPLLIANSG